MKKSLVRNICVSAVCLGILGGGYWMAVKWQPDKQESELAPVESAIPESVSIFECAVDDIKSVEVTSASGSYTVVCKDGRYTIEAASGNEYDESKLKSVLSSCSSITAVSEIEKNSERVAEFGLDGTEYVSVALSDGTHHKFILGSICAGDNNRYICKEGSEGIYTVGSGFSALLDKNVRDFIKIAVEAVVPEEIKGFEINKNGELLVQAESYKGDTVMGDFEMKKPYNGIMKQEKLNELFAELSNPPVLAVRDEAPQNISHYGFDSGVEIVFDTESGERRYKFASVAGNSDVYMKYGNGNVVYEYGGQAYNILMNIKPLDMLIKFMHIHNIDTVKSVEITHDGEKRLMEIAGDSYKIDGESYEEDKFKNIYQLVIGLLFVDYSDNKPTGEPQYTITFNFNDGTKDTAHYYAHDARLMNAEHNGSYYMVNADDVKNMWDGIKK